MKYYNNTFDLFILKDADSTEGEVVRGGLHPANTGYKGFPIEKVLIGANFHTGTAEVTEAEAKSVLARCEKAPAAPATKKRSR